MPVTWSISHEDRIVLASAEGDTSLADLEQYMSAVAAAGGMPYRKLFDASYVAPGALRLAELRASAGKVVALAAGETLGRSPSSSDRNSSRRWPKRSAKSMPGARWQFSATPSKRANGWTVDLKAASSTAR
ncbi:MAG: hypothetical protein GEV13_09700 [Rhodospirillales bacterium]|nr:hypothetical protein [Rhodospirillales bacterium]